MAACLPFEPPLAVHRPMTSAIQSQRRFLTAQSRGLKRAHRDSGLSLCGEMDFRNQEACPDDDGWHCQQESPGRRGGLLKRHRGSDE